MRGLRWRDFIAETVRPAVGPYRKKLDAARRRVNPQPGRLRYR